MHCGHAAAVGHSTRLRGSRTLITGPALFRTGTTSCPKVRSCSSAPGLKAEQPNTKVLGAPARIGNQNRKDLPLGVLQ